MPRCFAMLYSPSQWLVALCHCLAFTCFDSGLLSMAKDNMWSWIILELFGLTSFAILIISHISGAKPTSQVFSHSWSLLRSSRRCTASFSPPIIRYTRLPFAIALLLYITQQACTHCSNECLTTNRGHLLKLMTWHYWIYAYKSHCLCIAPPEP